MASRTVARLARAAGTSAASVGNAMPAIAMERNTHHGMAALPRSKLRRRATLLASARLSAIAGSTASSVARVPSAEIITTYIAAICREVAPTAFMIAISRTCRAMRAEVTAARRMAPRIAAIAAHAARIKRTEVICDWCGWWSAGGTRISRTVRALALRRAATSAASTSASLPSRATIRSSSRKGSSPSEASVSRVR